MFQIRENKQMRMTSHQLAMVLLRTCCPARDARPFGLWIVVGYRKEAAP
jgi:hypothetical protein